jgi:tetratricopeptide (TPR) repeat protein
MINTLAKLVFVFTLTFSTLLFADQTDPDLDKLFSELKYAQDAYVAQPIADQIWTIWLESNDEAINKLMAEGIKQVGSGSLESGRVIFTEVTKLFPNYAEGWNKLATVDYMMGDIDASLKGIEETLKREPRHFGAISGRGLCYLKLNRWQSALIEFKAALEIHPWLHDAKRNLQLLEENLENHFI